MLRPRSQKPEARSQKPEARSQKPEARSQKPETRNQKPETRRRLAYTLQTMHKGQCRSAHIGKGKAGNVRALAVQPAQRRTALLLLLLPVFKQPPSLLITNHRIVGAVQHQYRHIRRQGFILRIPV